MGVTLAMLLYLLLLSASSGVAYAAAAAFYGGACGTWRVFTGIYRWNIV
ncbi:MAG: hypothetical protein ACLTSZ_15305 [Lachnospiraceae bacterium]